MNNVQDRAWTDMQTKLQAIQGNTLPDSPLKAALSLGMGEGIPCTKL